MTDNSAPIEFAPIALERDTYDNLVKLAGETPSGTEIVGVCLGLAEFLCLKNQAYGDSALAPLRIFAKDLPTDALIRCRLDDKINRILKGHAAGEDVVIDIMGYLALIIVARERQQG